jgi:hypothetical protein
VVWPCFFFHAPSKPPPEQRQAEPTSPLPKTCKEASLFGLANQGQGYCV